MTVRKRSGAQWSVEKVAKTFRVNEKYEKESTERIVHVLGEEAPTADERDLTNLEERGHIEHDPISIGE